MKCRNLYSLKGVLDTNSGASMLIRSLMVLGSLCSQFGHCIFLSYMYRSVFHTCTLVSVAV